MVLDPGTLYPDYDPNQGSGSGSNDDVFNDNGNFTPIAGPDGILGTDDDPVAPVEEDPENIINPIIGGPDGIVGTPDDPDPDEYYDPDEGTPQDDDNDDSGTSLPSPGDIQEGLQDVWSGGSSSDGNNSGGSLFPGLGGGNNSGNDSGSNDSEEQDQNKSWKTLTIDYPREFSSGGSSMFGLGIVGQPVNYIAEVSGEIKAGEKANTGILGNDKVKDKKASGTVKIGRTDTYKFTGNIQNIGGSGNINSLDILVDGQEYSVDTSTGEIDEGDTTKPSIIGGLINKNILLLASLAAAALIYINQSKTTVIDIADPRR